MDVINLQCTLRHSCVDVIGGKKAVNVNCTPGRSAVLACLLNSNFTILCALPLYTTSVGESLHFDLHVSCCAHIYMRISSPCRKYVGLLVICGMIWQSWHLNM